MGVGAFNLLERSVIDAEEGLEWLRMEVADDAGLALMAKSRGARIELLSGRELIEVDWYPTLGSMLDGVMQRVIMGVGYYLGLYCLQCAAVILCLAAPVWLALYFSAYSPLGWLCLGAYALPSLILAAGMSKLKIPRRLLWALPLGYLVIGYGMLRALFTFLRRGGLYWRGGVYPLRELRASQRVRMGAFL